MNMKEIEEKINQYCQLCVLYAEATCELSRRSKISNEEAVRACKVYKPYIQDILRQVQTALSIFAMEKELRNLKGIGHFPVPSITPKGTQIKNPHQITKFLQAVDEEMFQILTIVRENERNYEKGKEEARIREQQSRATVPAQ